MPGDRHAAEAPVAATVTALRAALDPLAPDGPLGVAISGGGDSTALLLIARAWAGEQGRVVRAATVDHGLRPESAAEAEGVATLCNWLGVAHETLRSGDLRAAGGNLAAAARAARFALLADWADRHGLAAVLLGHTMDDQAETLLMRLARGSGIEGLAAMAPAVRRHGVPWLRPALGLRRAALREILRAEGVGWVEDPTNEDPAYDRVKARRALAALAPLGLTVEALARGAEHLGRQRRVLERAMHALAARARAFGALGEARLDVAAMAADEADTALRLLADTLLRVGGSEHRPRFEALAAAWEILRTAGKTTLAGCLILPPTAPGEPATICREPAACAGPCPLDRAEVLWDRRWRIIASGPWPADAHVACLGEAGLAALAIAAKAAAWAAPDPWAAAPRELRRTTPALWSGAGGDARLLAAPLPEHIDPDLAARGCTVSARFAGTENLPSPPLPD